MGGGGVRGAHGGGGEEKGVGYRIALTPPTPQ